MMKRKRRFTTLVAMMALAAAAQATTLRRMSLQELTTASAAVVRARCLGSESRWDSGRIWTFSQFEVLESFKGEPAGRIQVRLVGGRVGSLHSVVEGAPRFLPGEEAFLFLAPTLMGDWTVTGWALGTFRVGRERHSDRETVTQDAGAVTLFDPQTGQFHPGGVRQMEAEEFRRQVRQAIERDARRQR